MENYIFIIKILAYFIIYSFFGWVMETVLKTVIQKKLVNSGFLYGPFCPIYGFGAVFMLACLQGFKNNVILLFIIAFFTLSIWEYAVGWLLEKLFNTKYWDYTNNKFNIHGRVCLLNSLFWGFLGVIFIEFLHPFIEGRITQISPNLLKFNVIMVLIAIIVDTVASVINVTNIKSKLEKLKEISQTIKEKIEELENIQITKENAQEIIQKNKENLQDMIDELKNKQAKMKTKLLRRINHLKRAFPSIKSETIEKINEFLKDKKEKKS